MKQIKHFVKQVKITMIVVTLNRKYNSVTFMNKNDDQALVSMQ